MRGQSIWRARQGSIGVIAGRLGPAYRWLMIACVALCPHAAASEKLSIFSEESPPYQFFDADGKLTGINVETFREIQRLVGNDDPIQVVPWARAYDAILTKPRVVVLSMARTEEREPLFKWIGPLRETTYGFYGKADSMLSLSSLEQAKALPRIGVYLNDARDQLLTKAGFTNLDRAKSQELNIKKLMAGRFPVYADSSLTYAKNVRQAGFSPAEVKLIYAFKRVPIYIAMSKDMPEGVVAAWQEAWETLRKSGTHLKIQDAFSEQ